MLAQMNRGDFAPMGRSTIQSMIMKVRAQMLGNLTTTINGVGINFNGIG
jgi:hypothetical protein